MRDKATILNELVASAADIMEAKGAFNEAMIETLLGEYDQDIPPTASQAATIEKLSADIDKIKSAIGFMRQCAGSWG